MALIWMDKIVKSDHDDNMKYSQRWIEQPFTARGKERRKERGNKGLKINLEIIII